MNPIGLYVHIPFCQQKCRYCDFSSFPGMDVLDIERYIDALCLEIRNFAKINGIIPVQTIYFGGGTPSYIDEIFISRVMMLIKKYFNLKESAEITLEANPATVDLKKAQTYIQIGINRISIGLQTTDDKLLKTIGRIHTYRDFVESYKTFTKAGFTNLSADLMFGLPNQTLSHVKEDIKRLADFPMIKHISGYSLKVEEGTTFGAMEKTGTLRLPNENTERAMQHLMIKDLAALGFEQYEISNFARAGHESRHNSLYWTLDPYVGFGLGASSYYKEERKTNTSNFEDYCTLIKAGKFANVEAHIPTQDEKKGDFMFLGLRKTKGVCNKTYQSFFGTSFYQDFPEIKDLIKKGLLLCSGDRIRLSEKGQDLGNLVFMAFV